MERYRVGLSEPAENDLRDVVRYISVQLSAPMTAAGVMDALEEAIAGLAEMPLKCPLVGDERLAAMGYRKLVVKNNIILFTANEKTRVVDVERVLYARRNWLNIL